MQRTVLPILALLCLIVWSTAFFLSHAGGAETIVALPTLMVLPTLTNSSTPLPTNPATHAPTLFPDAALSLKSTTFPTASPTLATRVLMVQAIMSGVTVAPTATPFPPGTILLPSPPDPIEPLPDATDTAPPFTGWYSFESDYPTIQYEPAWTPRLAPFASRGQYHRAEDALASATFPFEGEGVRVRYIVARNMGWFELVVDGQILDTIDAFDETLASSATRVYFVGSGQHRLQIRGAGRRNDQSEGYVTGLDTIQVYRADSTTRILPSNLTATSTPQPQDALRVDLVSAPPTVQPTGTAVPPRVLTASLVIAYDENGNDAVDPAEGVAGISVRVVEANTNRVIASGFTDMSGYVQFELVTDSPAGLVVPYFGESWELQGGTTSAASAFTLLLNPGNQPGLIP